MKFLSKNIFAFEGIDYSGKTTIIRNLKTKLISNGFEIIVVEGMKSSSLGTIIRPYFLNNEKVINETRFLLSFANMFQIQKELIIPNLKENVIILIDRWILSNLVYQAKTNKVDPNLKLYNQIKNQFQIIQPNKTFLLDIEISTYQKRKIKNQHEFDLIENLGINYIEKVKNEYLSIAKSDENIIKFQSNNFNGSEIFNSIYEEILKQIQF